LEIPFRVKRKFFLQPLEMWWTEVEEGMQAQAELAGVVPPLAVLPDEDIAMDPEPFILWHIPEEGGPPPVEPMLLNGVQMDYVGELADQLQVALALFGPPEEDPPLQ